MPLCVHEMAIPLWPVLGVRSLTDIPMPPVRLCCFTRHWDAVCPDNTFMCCLCFDKIAVEDAYVDDEGGKWDACEPCMAIDMAPKG